MTGDKWWRWGGIWFTPGFHAVAVYRLNRAAYVALGRGYSVARVALSPVTFALRPWAPRCEIHYQADLGPGLLVLHPALGVVVSAKTVAGKGLVLVGGNCIGSRGSIEHGAIRLGDDVSLGANAVVLGPITIGNGVRVGAGAVVVKDVADGETVRGPTSTAFPSARTQTPSR
jgi:serine acetyltransferase